MKPANNSDIGQSIDKVFYWILGITTIVFIGTQAVLVWFLIRYREKKHTKQTIIYSHGSNVLEFVWTAIPALILVILAFTSEMTWDRARKTPPENPLHIRVLGRQYQWNFVYPGADGILGTDDDLEDPLLKAPVGRPVMFHISSQDVLHSFWLPSFRIKQDAMPGANVKVWMTPLETGKFEVACAEFCGISHGEMKAQFEVVTEEEFAAYLAEVEQFTFGYGDDDGGYE
jgi:cytochrome c oxidase subunit 2